MKIARRCGKKIGTSRKASVMTFRGNKPHVIKSPSIMKEGESNSSDMVMDGQTLGRIITKNCWIHSRNSSLVMYGKHFKITGNCIRRNIRIRLMIRMRT
jgi:hypothetical protein